MFLPRMVVQADVEKPMSMSDAMQMPLIAGGALTALFVLFKYVDAEWVNLALRLYFLVIGTFAVGDCTAWLLEAAVRSLGGPAVTRRFAVLPLGMGSISIYHLPGILIGAAVAGGEAYAKLNGLPFHWLLNNSVGAAVCFEALGKLSVGSVRTGMLLLVGLFVYDVVMVFGTESLIGEGIMQSVAAKVDGPILLMFPHYNASLPADQLPKFSKLGLGDICFPGAFIALLLRYDAFRSGRWLPASDPGTTSQRAKIDALAKEDPKAVMPAGHPGGAATAGTFSSPYFIAGTTLYVLGLAVTLVVMLVFEHPQPALLYLSPACCLAALGVAAVLGDWEGVMSYSEEAPEDGVIGKPRDDTGVAEAPETTIQPLDRDAGTLGDDSGGEWGDDDESDGVLADQVVAAPSSGSGTRRRARRE